MPLYFPLASTCQHDYNDCDEIEDIVSLYEIYSWMCHIITKSCYVMETRKGDEKGEKETKILEGNEKNLYRQQVNLWLSKEF